MAAPTLSVLTSPDFPQTFDRVLSRLERLVIRAEARAAQLELSLCDFEDEHCDCRRLATVHHLASEHEYCDRHFQQIEKGRE